jgi:hypothetical protein
MMTLLPPASLGTAIWLKAPVLVTMVAFLPLYAGNEVSAPNWLLRLHAGSGRNNRPSR